MLIDLRHAQDQGPRHAETLVIGSGAVGLTLAVSLARAGRRVIVLEAGASRLEPASQQFFKSARWRSQQLLGLHEGRFRVLGGTTNFWGGQLVPFDPIVFEPRPWVADIGWPIAREDLDPYYARGYDLLGMAHHLTDDKVWDRLKVAPPSFGSDLEFFFSAWAPEPNLATLFSDEVNGHAGMCVFVNAPVVALELDETGERVVKAVVRTAAGTCSFTGDRIVLANGTVEIARLLKLPAAGGRATPWHSNPWLGKGFVDHIDCLGGEIVPTDKKRFHELFDNAYFDGIKYNPKLRLTSSAQRERKLLDVSAHVLFNSNMQQHLENAKLLLRSMCRGRLDRSVLAHVPSIVSNMHVIVPMVARYLRYHRMYNPVNQGIQLRIISEQLPTLESAIHLDKECDDLGMPLVEINWHIDGREIESMAAVGELAQRYLAKHALATVTLDPALKARDPAFLRRADDSFHHMGMARMANSPAQGVVDRDLKVFGTQNLYIAGAAVYPTSGFANPTFTAIALGLRFAEAVCADTISGSVTALAA